MISRNFSIYTLLKKRQEMNLQDSLQFRRAVRHFDAERPLNDNAVKACIELAQLAPTSSNMQLWEAYQVTDKATLSALATACLGQVAATTAQQFVVFVTRPALHRQRAKENLDFLRENVRQTSPQDRWQHRTERYEKYYGKLMPFLYSRCFGLLGMLRKTLSMGIGLFRPIVRQVSEADVRVSIHQSCAFAAQTFMLAMAEQGMDTCPLGGFDSQRVRHILHLPADAEVALVVSCGYRMERGVWGDRFRVPFEAIYHKV